MKHPRFRRVQILWLILFINLSPTKSNHAPDLIPDREHQPLAKRIVLPTTLARFHHPSLQKRFNTHPALLRHHHQPIPTIRRCANPEPRNHLIANPTMRDHPPRLLTMLRMIQNRLKEPLRDLVRTHHLAPADPPLIARSGSTILR